MDGILFASATRSRMDVMKQQTTPDDAALMARIAQRDNTALAELYDRFGSRVYGIAINTLQNRALAEEATQDTFIKVWTQSARWDPARGQLAPWLLTVARYTAVDRLRKEKQESPWTAIGLEELLGLIGKPNVIDENIWYDAKRVEDLLRELTPEQREAINLAFFHGLTHTEIAARLQTPLGTIKSRIRDGLTMLKGLWLHE